MNLALLERPVTDANQRPVSELLVLWQHPRTREILPVGRFSYDGSTFAFAYTQTASQIEGFRPLPGMDDLESRHMFSDMPPVLGQRIMSAERPDFSTYLGSLGLPNTATPWEQIVASGGGRAGDTLQFMAMPEVREGHARARFFVNGIRHVPDYPARLAGTTVRVSQGEHETAIGELVPGSRLTLTPEHHNAVDPTAVLLTHQGIPIGWAPRLLSPSLTELVGSGARSVRVLRVADSPEPSHTRIVVDLDAPCPEGFMFDRSGAWLPNAA